MHLATTLMLLSMNWKPGNCHVYGAIMWPIAELLHWHWIGCCLVVPFHLPVISIFTFCTLQKMNQGTNGQSVSLCLLLVLISKHLTSHLSSLLPPCWYYIPHLRVHWLPQSFQQPWKDLCLELCISFFKSLSSFFFFPIILMGVEDCSLNKYTGIRLGIGAKTCWALLWLS